MKRDEADQLKGARWSSTTRCARMGAYSALGTIPSPITSDAVAGMFERGHDLEDVYHRRLQERYSGPIEREVAIPWGGDGWELHLDFLLPDADREHTECKSNQHIGTIPGPNVDLHGFETKAPVLQVAGAAVFDPEGGTARVAVISPVNYTYREFDIELTSDLVAGVRDIADRVCHAAETGELPPRVCTVPSDAVGRFCPYADTCFATWEPAEQVETEGAAAMLAQQLRVSEDAVREAGRDKKLLEAERDDLRRRMRDYTRPGLEYVLGGVRVRRTVSAKGRRTFKLRDALATGALKADEIDGPLSRLGNYVSESAPVERWTVGDPIEDDDE